MPTTSPLPILTTTVGSYSVADWLSALPSEQAVLDIKINHLETADEIAAAIDRACNSPRSSA